MKIENLVGIYTVIGSNQDESDRTYKGELALALDDNKRIIAKWLINIFPFSNTDCLFSS